MAALNPLCPRRCPRLPAGCVWLYGFRDQPEVVEVGEIQDLEVVALDPDVVEGGDLVEDLLRCAGEAVFAQICWIASDRFCAAYDLGFVLAAAHDLRDRVDQRAGVPPARLTGLADAVVHTAAHRRGLK